jgi:hypothetical protein
VVPIGDPRSLMRSRGNVLPRLAGRLRLAGRPFGQDALNRKYVGDTQVLSDEFLQRPAIHQPHPPLRDSTFSSEDRFDASTVTLDEFAGHHPSRIETVDETCGCRPGQANVASQVG